MMKYLLCLPIIAVFVSCEATLPPAASPPVTPAVSDEPPMPEPNSPENKSDEKSVEKIKKIRKTKRQWKQELSDQEYHVLRQKGTERAFTGEYDKHFEPGAYACAGCGLVLFESDTKFNSGCGWPAFYAAKAGDRVVQTPDYSHGMVRVEVTCARCDGHLGHVFEDAPGQPTGQRYCINSVSLDFIPQGKVDKGNAAAANEPNKPAKSDQSERDGE